MYIFSQIDKIEEGESPEEALQRELKEELNIEVEILEGLPPYPAIKITGFSDNNPTIFKYIFRSVDKFVRLKT